MEHDWPRIAAAAVVPMAMVSASGLLALALYNRLAAVVSRLRTFERERLAEARRVGAGEATAEPRYLEHLHEQIAQVTRRATLLRRALLLLLAGVAAVLCCSLASALAIEAPAVGHVALGFYTVGVLCVLAAVLTAMSELARALEPVMAESAVVDELTGELTGEET